jgi:tryptophan synthase beta subunit
MIQVDKNGFFGSYGGAFVPEMLQSNLRELSDCYVSYLERPDFQHEFQDLLEYYVGRPTPLYLASRLSEELGFKVYLKREDLCHTGAHKINNAIGQILLARHLGKKRIIAETGAGQHGVATATVCALMNMDCVVYMGATDIERQAPNVARMKMLGAEVRAVHSGTATLKDATNEAIRDWIANPGNSYYLIGSAVGPHPYPDLVARLQSVISAEIRRQLFRREGRENPDLVVACIGGGSNAIGAYYHYIDEIDVSLLAVEAAGKGLESGHTAATSIVGTPGVLHGSYSLQMQDEDGQIKEPYSLSAGLDYPGMSPIHAHLLQTDRLNSIAVTDEQALSAALRLTRLEGIIPALETAHALAALDEIKLDSGQIVVLNLSGRGDKDLATFQGYFEL